MKFRNAAIFAGAFVLAASIATSASFINSIVGVCNPATPANCVAVDASGNVPTTISGTVPLPSGAATAALQTSTMTTNHTDLSQLHSDLVAALPAGANVIGAVSQSGAWNIANITGTVSLATGAATSANQPTNSAQAAGTFGQTGTLILVASTSTAPSYGSGTSNPFSSDLAGNLRVVDIGNVASGSADTGAPVKVGGIYNSTLPTFTNGLRGDLQIGTRGSVDETLMSANSVTPIGSGTAGDALSNQNGLSTLSQNQIFNGTTFDLSRSIQGINGTGLGVTAVEQGGASFSNITTATTTTVKSGAGTLHKICINTYVASGTITMYNNTSASGTKIGTVTNPAALLKEGPDCETYDVYFSIGLTIVTTGAQDITVVYR